MNTTVLDKNNPGIYSQFWRSLDTIHICLGISSIFYDKHYFQMYYLLTMILILSKFKTV